MPACPGSRGPRSCPSGRIDYPLSARSSPLSGIPMVPQMSTQPVTSGLRAAGRIAGVGLALVLVFLAVFAVWASNRSVNATSRLKRSQLISSAYSRARFAMDDERLLAQRYMFGHGGHYATAGAAGLQARFDGFASQATKAPPAPQRVGDPRQPEPRR